MSKQTLISLLAQYDGSSSDFEAQVFFLEQIVSLMESANGDGNNAKVKLARDAYTTLEQKCYGNEPQNDNALNKLISLGLYPWAYADKIDTVTLKNISNVLCRIIINTEAQVQDNGYILDNFKADMQELFNDSAIIGKDGLQEQSL